jgi:hypothetical protein
VVQKKRRKEAQKNLFKGIISYKCSKTLRKLWKSRSRKLKESQLELINKSPL